MNNQNQNRNQNSNQNKNEKENRTENRSENQSQNILDDGSHYGDGGDASGGGAADGKRAPGIPGARKFFILPQIFPAGRNRDTLP